MAINKARKAAASKKQRAGDSAPETPPHGPVHVPPPLPPGVYFSPTPDDCLGLLNRWIAGDSEMLDARGYVFPANVYGESPDALRLRHPPASVRGPAEHTWWFLSQTKFQSGVAGGGASKRADRTVTAGGFWRIEQSREKLDLDGHGAADGVKNCYGYYVGKDDRTPWLMQEFTSANDDGTGKSGVPALYKVYASPRARPSALRDIFGEDGVKKGPDGTKKTGRTMVPEDYFDRIAGLLPPGSVRGVGQQHVQAPPPPPPPPAAPEGFLDYYGQHLGDYQQQQYPPLPPPASPGLLGEIAPSDNLSMPMDEFMKMLEQPAEVDVQQPAETVKGEEPNWGSLGNIVDDDELANFNMDG